MAATDPASAVTPLTGVDAGPRPGTPPRAATREDRRARQAPSDDHRPQRAALALVGRVPRLRDTFSRAHVHARLALATPTRERGTAHTARRILDRFLAR